MTSLLCHFLTWMMQTYAMPPLVAVLMIWKRAVTEMKKNLISKPCKYFSLPTNPGGLYC